MEGLQMKYFVLNPKSKGRKDRHAFASRQAMRTYADCIESTNSNLASELREWVLLEDYKSKLSIPQGNVKASDFMDKSFIQTCRDKLLEKLEEIRCGLIDIETAIGDKQFKNITTKDAT